VEKAKSLFKMKSVGDDSRISESSERIHKVLTEAESVEKYRIPSFNRRMIFDQVIIGDLYLDRDFDDASFDALS